MGLGKDKDIEKSPDRNVEKRGNDDAKTQVIKETQKDLKDLENDIKKSN